MNHSSKPIIVAEQLTKRVQAPEGVLTILSDIHLKIHAGEAVAILGASGSGKSTLLGLLAGLDTATAGYIRLFDTDLGQIDEDGRAKLRAGKVGFVFQSFHLLAGLTALENVLLPLELMGHVHARRTAIAVLQQVGLGQRLHHTPQQLSGGEQQRVAIARAFASKPLILFADEPTGNLDSVTGQRIIEVLLTLKTEVGTALVLVTHDAELATQCDRRYLLEKGEFLTTPKNPDC